MNLGKSIGPVSPRDFTAEYRLEFTDNSTHRHIYDRGSSVSVRSTFNDDGSMDIVINCVRPQIFQKLKKADLDLLLEFTTIPELCDYVHEKMENQDTGYSIAATVPLVLYSLAADFRGCIKRKVIAMPECEVIDITPMAEEALKHGLTK